MAIRMEPHQRPEHLDWEAIEHDYKWSSLSMDDLVEKHACHKSTIYERAKLGGWRRMGMEK